MKALRIFEEGLQLVDSELRHDPAWKVVDVLAAGLNRRDYWITIGKYPGLSFPCTLGSDALGTIEGRRVIVNPGLFWPRYSAYQPDEFKILGMPHDGTFAEKVNVPAENIHSCPAHLTDEEAACIGLGGLTAYRALFVRGRLAPGETVLISGVGGGVALLATQFALALGCKVWVTSGNNDKIIKAMEMGAQGGVLYSDERRWHKLQAVGEPIDVLIDSSGAGLGGAEEVMNYGGRMVIYGGTSGDIPALNSRKFFWKQLELMGSTMGSSQEFADMLAFVEKYKIRPIVDATFVLEEYEPAFQRMAQHDQFGKLVFRITR